VPIDGGVREQAVGGGPPEGCVERTGDRRSPSREGDGREVAVQPLVAARDQRRSTFVQADEDRIDAGSRREVAAVECVQNPQREPRSEQQRSERHSGSAHKALRGLTLKDEIPIPWRHLRVHELSHEVGCDVERGIRHDDVVGQRQAAGEDVAFAHDDVRHVMKTPPKATHEGRVAFDRDHARASASQCGRENTRTRAEVVDDIARTELRERDELRGERGIGDRVLRSPELTSRSG
jgi:hypothetical protein